MEIRSSALSVIPLNDGREDRLRYIYHLHQKGWSNKEISQHLNDMSVRTPRGGEYYPNLIWATLSKYMKRLDRLRYNTDLIKIEERCVMVVDVRSG